MNEDAALLRENTKSDYKTKLKKAFIWFWRICIFAITGSSSVHVTSALLHWLHFSKNAWYYYVMFILVETVVYTIMLVSIGTIFFQWRYFCTIAFRLWAWLMPKRWKAWCTRRLDDSPTTLL
ncbi:unnamed protein product [Rhizopus microsporus]|uniref:DUF6787 domain-containing protein n=1 Tax=Rhizopus microsporus TaxID=58291 RepID=A0A0A1P4C3_RHIZD|nr:hypothetical protein BCV71DRAFT_290780 [Rhizopus microsporus]CEI99742.1 hypothetical protein RMCBS344292_13823 [Rhizopus microsporus]